MTTLGNEEYEQIKKFLAFYIERTLDISKIPPESRPLAQILLLEAKDKRKAAAGVVQAVNDCLMMSLRLPSEKVLELDSELRALGLPTLSHLRVKYSKQYAALMARGVIRNETDYYLIKGALEDSDLLGEEMREKASQMMVKFEGKKRRQ